MDTYLIDIGVSIVLRAIKDSIKSPEKKESLSRVMRKIYDKIVDLYPEFKEEN